MNIPQEIVFLLILLGLGLISKNQSIIISVIILLAIRLSGLGEKLFPVIDKQGVNVGIIILMIAVLVPIATGNIKLSDLLLSLKSSYGILALISGIIVSLLAGYGVNLLEQTPQVTIALVIGTIFSIIFLKGIPVGPLIGAGVAMVLIQAYQWIDRFFS